MQLKRKKEVLVEVADNETNGKEKTKEKTNDDEKEKKRRK